MASARQCATRIVRKLQDAGFETYLAGGCVRDMLLCRKPKDYDIATAAPPSTVQGVIRRTKPIGKAFGVIQARMEGHDFEIATFRSDHDYLDGRRPSAVTFSDARSDAMRRDFTVNAMFFDPVSQAYIDYAGGIPDIAAKRIRTVGSPDDRFKEDHLRMLRAVRFSQSLGFTLEKDTAARIQKNAPSIERISAERIQGELFRILLESAEPGSAILLLHRLGLMRQILPLTSRSHAASQLKRTAGILNALARQPLEVLLTALLLRTGMPAGRAATAGHRHSIHKKTRRELQSLRVSKAIEQHVLQSQSLYWELAQVRKHIPRERLPDLLTPHADTVFAILSVGLPARAVSLSETRATVRNRMKMRPIGGSDLKKSGLVAGPAMGRAIKEALILQCEGLKKREILAKLKLS